MGKDKQEAYGAALNKEFKTKLSNIELYEKLRTLEIRGKKAVLDWKSKEITIDEYDVESKLIIKKLGSILNCSVLDDPDGYPKYPIYFDATTKLHVLKIDSEYATKHNMDIQRDEDGHGIIAPDLS